MFLLILFQLVYSQTITNYQIIINFHNAIIINEDSIDIYDDLDNYKIFLKKIIIDKIVVGEYTKDQELENIFRNLFAWGRIDPIFEGKKLKNICTNLSISPRDPIDQIFYVNRVKIKFKYCKDNNVYFYLYYALHNFKKNVHPFWLAKEGLSFVLTDKDNNVFNDIKTCTIKDDDIRQNLDNVFFIFNPCLFINHDKMNMLDMPRFGFPTGKLEEKLSYEEYIRLLDLNFNNNPYFNKDFNTEEFKRKLYNNAYIDADKSTYFININFKLNLEVEEKIDL